MSTYKKFTNNSIWNKIQDNSPTIVGTIGITVLILAAILNLAGFVSGLDFFALFVLSFIIMLAAVGLMDSKKDWNQGQRNSGNLAT